MAAKNAKNANPSRKRERRINIANCRLRFRLGPEFVGHPFLRSLRFFAAQLFALQIADAGIFR